MKRLLKRSALLFKSLVDGLRHKRSFVLSPRFEDPSDVEVVLHKLTWYLPDRERTEIRYSVGKTAPSSPKKKNPPKLDHLHALPTLRTGLRRTRFNHPLWSLLACRDILVWNYEEFKKRHPFLSRWKIGKVIDYATLDYLTDYHLTGLHALTASPDVLKDLLKTSQLRFSEEVSKLKKQYKKAYAFGRGPSLGAAFEYDFSDGVRIICNNLIINRPLMDHIRPQILTFCDHFWHFGCSKIAEQFRNDVVTYAKENPDLKIIVPFDTLPLLHHHLPSLRDALIGIPYAGQSFNFDLLNRFEIFPSAGVLQEFLIPIATTLATRVELLGVDGAAPKSDTSDVVKVPYPLFNDVNYSQELRQTANDTRPGYYEANSEPFKPFFDADLTKLIQQAKSSGLQIKSLKPSFHACLNG